MINEYMPKKELILMENENFVPASFNRDSGTNRQLSVTLDISDFQKNTSCIF